MRKRTALLLQCKHKLNLSLHWLYSNMQQFREATFYQILPPCELLKLQKFSTEKAKTKIMRVALTFVHQHWELWFLRSSFPIQCFWGFAVVKILPWFHLSTIFSRWRLIIYNRTSVFIGQFQALAIMTSKWRNVFFLAVRIKGRLLY